MPTHTRPDHQSPTRARSSPATLHALIRHLTPRDRQIMRLVWHHRVFTTDQLARLCFTSYNTAKKRLHLLHRVRALDRFRPWVPTGSAPWHYVLDAPGAEILAAEDGVGLREFGYRRDRVLTLAYRSSLGHTVGVNQVYVDLYGHSRYHNTRLHWWTGAECTQQWGDVVRPDAAGYWTEANSRAGFFLEYDTGTETLARLKKKLDAYAELARVTSHRGTVLFWLPSQQRAHNLQRHVPDPPVPAAVAVHGQHPAEAVWSYLGDPTARRYRLAELAPIYQPHQPALFGWEDADG